MRAIVAGFVVAAQGVFFMSQALAQPVGSALRVAFVMPAREQPQQHDRGLIFYEDFDLVADWRARFFEYGAQEGSFVWAQQDGLNGGAMRCQFEKGQVSAGSLRVLFGENPFGRGLRQEETFREICWRVYVKHELGWEGNPAKLARATCLAGRDWNQGFIAHVWGGKSEVFCIDPATGIRDRRKVTTRYNDFPNLKWLGLRQGQTPLFSPAESGRWACVESHVKLNVPGALDGVFELWVDGKLEAARDDLDWHGDWSEYAINAVFLENYWNQGSVKRQARWFDNFVISTQPIGPITASMPPTLTLKEPSGDREWEAQGATDSEGKDIVWTSKTVAATRERLTVDATQGAFTGSCTGKQRLTEGATRWVRVRQVNQAAWSPWHAPFR